MNVLKSSTVYVSVSISFLNVYIFDVVQLILYCTASYGM